MSFFDRYIQAFEREYPSTAKAVDVRSLLSPNLPAEHILELPKSILNRSRKIVASFHELRESRSYQDFVAAKTVELGKINFSAGNYSALMCFDFHSSGDQLKLIEINTNASVSLIGDLVYKTHGLKNDAGNDFQNEITRTFQAEHALVSGGSRLSSAAIVDQKPSTQRLYIEFLMYKELFERNQIETEIFDTNSLVWDASSKKLTTPAGKAIDLVYNRDTDFFLDDSQALKSAWMAKAATVSPNPHEYSLLADKQRIEDLSQSISAGALSKTFAISESAAKEIESTILKSISVMTLADSAWSERKKYFFKPKRSFGSKAVYKGASISRTMFESQVLTNDYVAQEFAPAPTVKVKVADGSEQEFKFDLRFFTYRDQVQSAVARLYQGQTTNAQTPGGGIAAIRWI